MSGERLQAVFDAIRQRQKSNGCWQHGAGADGLPCCDDCWCAHEAVELPATAPGDPRRVSA